MRRISSILFLACLLLASCASLRLHMQAASQPRPESPDQLANLTDKESAIAKKLSLVSLQIAATNNTIAKNLYIPEWIAGNFTLHKVDENSTFDPQQTAQLCLVFNDSQASDVEAYIASIEDRLNEVKGDIAALGSSSPHQQDLQYLQEKYTKKNEYFKFLLMNPCQYYSEGNFVPTGSQPNQTQLQEMVKINPTNWFTNQNLQNYVVEGNQLEDNTCPPETPYIINGICSKCTGTKPIFDVKNKICIQCASNTYFSEITHTCKPIVGEHCSGGRYETADGICVCRTGSPYWNGKSCISCVLPSYFDFEKSQCLSCQPGYYFNGMNCAPTNCSSTYTFDIQN